jgi:hypothetical protein
LQYWQKFLKKYSWGRLLRLQSKNNREIGLCRAWMQVAASINPLSHLQDCWKRRGQLRKGLQLRTHSCTLILIKFTERWAQEETKRYKWAQSLYLGIPSSKSSVLWGFQGSFSYEE